MRFFQQIISTKTWLLLGCTILVFLACEKPLPPGKVLKNPFADVDTAQVESVLRAMTVDEKIGQLVFLRSELRDSAEKAALLDNVNEGKIGGLMFDNIWIEDYLQLKDSLCRISKLPLFLGTTQKVSLFNQFKGLEKFPTPAAIAALDSVGLQETLERHYLKQCKALGINFAFNPSFELNDTSNQAFNFQLYESDTQAVMMRSYRTLKHFQNERIVSVGSGFSNMLFLAADSLRDTLLRHYLISTREGLGGMLINDALFQNDTLEKTGAGFVKKYLRNYLDFNGLMAVSLNQPKSLELKWAEGADLFITADADRTYTGLQNLYTKGKMDAKSLDDRVRQVLTAKAWAHGGRLPVELSIMPTDSSQQPVHLVSLSPKKEPKLVRVVPPRPDNLDAQIEEIRCYFEDPNWAYFNEILFEKSVVLAHNHEKLLPVKQLLGSRFEIFEYGRQPFRDFKRVFLKYATYSSQELNPVTAGDLKPISPQTENDSLVAVVLLDSINLLPKRHKAFIDSLNQLSRQRKTVLVNFGNPKNFQYFDSTLTCLQIFQRNKVTEAYAAQVLFGGMNVDGKMPLEAAVFIPYGASVHNAAIRLGYANPEKAGIAEERLVGINAIAETAIDRSVFPGCQVVLAKDGQVIFSEAFGKHTYDKKGKAVSTTDLYDIASITKVAATTLATMKLYERGVLDLKGSIAEYLPLNNGEKIGDIKIKELLLHSSGLQSQMPIGKFFSWRNVPAKGCNSFFCRLKRRDFSIQVAKGLYLRNDYRDSIFQRVKKLPVGKKSYRYSDVNFFLLQKISEALTKTPMDKFLDENIYHSLGLRYTTFNPIRHFSLKNIVPTENDRSWRHTLVEGFVHDPAAALLGGVSGNAGLFSNAEDLAVVFQVFLNKGVYGGVQYFEGETIDMFTKEYAGTNRSLGFEKPAEKRYPSYSKQSSPQSFGHTGFTGTCVWVDPENNLVYIFLSNRIHPSARNAKIFSEAVRSRIHEVVYDAFDSFQLQLPELNAEVTESK